MAIDALRTTLLLIRHGERQPPAPADPDPPLNGAGNARAQKLVHVVGQSGIEAIYTSHFTRSRETARPLAAHLGELSTTEIDEALDIRNDILANHLGKTILVVGHSDTVPDLINSFGGGDLVVISDDEFDNLFVVTLLGASAVNVTRLKYGEPS